MVDVFYMLLLYMFVGLYIFSFKSKGLRKGWDGNIRIGSVRRAMVYPSEWKLTYFTAANGTFRFAAILTLTL